MTWRNCEASLALVAEVNARWPNRDRTSDGTIGDAAHATRVSDHNPWVIVNGVGVVRARDIDVDGIDAAWLAEYLRQIGARRDPRLWPGGYVIFNRRITAPDFSRWNAYTGDNPHTKHVHVSFSTLRAGFDSRAAWGITGAAPTAPAPLPGPGTAPPIEEDEDVTAPPIRLSDSGRFAECFGAEAGGGGWFRAGVICFGSAWGYTDVAITALSADGRVMPLLGAPGKLARIENNHSVTRDLPDGCRAVTIEGRVQWAPKDAQDGLGTRPWVMWVGDRT